MSNKPTSRLYISEYIDNPTKIKEVSNPETRDKIVNDVISNPKAMYDMLPQPFRFISKIIDNKIIFSVFQKIKVIEEKRNTSSYEGHLKEVGTTGILDINDITCFAEEGDSQSDKKGLNKLLIGDNQGNVYLIDTKRKIILSKEQLYTSQRVIHISTATIGWLDTYITICCVAAQASNKLTMVYYKDNDNKIIKLSTIKVNEEEIKEDTDYSHFAHKTKISMNIEFLCVVKYDGSIDVLKLPQLIEVALKKENEQSMAAFIAKIKRPVSQIDTTSIFEESFQFKEYQYADLLKFSLPAKTEPPELIDPTKPKKEEQEEEESQQNTAQKDVKIFTNPPLFGVINQKEVDNSRLLSQAIIMPDVYFVVNDISYSDNPFTSIMKKAYITTSLLIVYVGLSEVLMYQLQNCTSDNIPMHHTIEYYTMKFKLTDQSSQPKKKEKEALKTAIAAEKVDPPASKPEYKISLRKQYEMPYKISCCQYLEINESLQYLALGLIDGSVIIIDISVGFEKCYTVKHSKEVTSIAFYGIGMIISGAADGSVHIDTIENESRNKFKAFNNPDTQSPIVRVWTSELGVGLALDSAGYIRVYDLHRFKKICKFTPNQKTSDKKFKWRIIPSICCSSIKDIFVCICEENGENGRKQYPTYHYAITNFENKPFILTKSNFCIYRLQDILLSIFPQYSNLMKQGLTFEAVFKIYDPISLLAIKNSKSVLSDDIKTISKISSQLNPPNISDSPTKQLSTCVPFSNALAIRKRSTSEQDSQSIHTSTYM